MWLCQYIPLVACVNGLYMQVGCRCHGGEGSWLPITEECIGYSQIEATLNCYLRSDRFNRLPAKPDLLLKQGVEVFLVSRQAGKCRP